MALTAKDIIGLLGARHASDVFIPECKDGPTWFSNHSRLDAWAMKRSWATPCYWAYEVKVSRSDFVNDTKWPGYLPLCNELYFACPAKLIAPEECPEQCGLLWASTTGTRLYMKKKAPWREIEPPESLMVYALMRARGFNRELHQNEVFDIAYWRDWLAQKREARTIGHNVSREISAIVQERIVKVECENKWLKAENERFAELRKFLDERGLSIGHWDVKGEIERTLTGHVPKRLRGQLERYADAARRASEAMGELMKLWDEAANPHSQAVPPPDGGGVVMARGEE